MTATDWAAKALSNAKAAVFWSDRVDAPRPRPVLEETLDADLAIIGGGFTGLWAAIQALEERPGLRVVVLEAERCGFGASSRNGGFCHASLTHGLENGLLHWPEEVQTLVGLGRDNLKEIEETIERYGIDADFRRVPMLRVATEAWHLEGVDEVLAAHRRVGDDIELLDQVGVRSRVNSPTYIGGVLQHNDAALVDPARLIWGLQEAVTSLGGAIYEQTPVIGLSRSGPPVLVKTSRGAVNAAHVVMATNAYPGVLRRLRRYVIPVYDHVLMTEPLNSSQLVSIGWEERDGVVDMSNQFHYYRLSADNRILWGGYDATYHFGNGLGPRFDQSEETHGKLARHFFETFPQLEGVRFTHRWGGPIATTTRFTATWGRSHGGHVAWVAGYTGLGVGASRFGARVALDLVWGETTERTALSMVRKPPFPFPAEPLRWAGVTITRRAIRRADEREGRRGLWLRLLDRFGIGFDS